MIYTQIERINDFIKLSHYFQSDDGNTDAVLVKIELVPVTSLLKISYSLQEGYILVTFENDYFYLVPTTDTDNENPDKVKAKYIGTTQVVTLHNIYEGLMSLL